MISVFLLVRDEDETGVSGTGVVAAGMEFPDGAVVMRWLVGEHHSTVMHDSMHAVEKIHGHNGKTRIVRVGKLNPMAPDPKFNVRDAYEAKIKSYTNFVGFPAQTPTERSKGTFHVERKVSDYISSNTDTGAKPLTLDWLNDYCKKIAIESAKRMEEEVIWGRGIFGDLSTAKNETRIPVVSSLSPT